MHKYSTDVVIPVDEDLADEAILALERDLGEVPGVYSACVNDLARHLMLVDYESEGVHAGQLLAQVRRHGVGAELVGL